MKYEEGDAGRSDSTDLDRVEDSWRGGMGIGSGDRVVLLNTRFSSSYGMTTAGVIG